MAGRPKKIEAVEVQEPVLVEEVQEIVEIQEVVEAKEPIEDSSDSVVSVKESEEVPTEAPPVVPTIAPTEETYNPKDIVEFYNLKGELRYAPYAYIVKRGYKPLRKYTKK